MKMAKGKKRPPITAPYVTDMLGCCLPGSSEQAGSQTMDVWKLSTCGDCGVGIPRMLGKGYRVVGSNVNDPASISHSLGVPSALRACHDSTINDHSIEGHAPAAAVARLLEQRPGLAGITLPDSPPGRRVWMGRRLSAGSSVSRLMETPGISGTPEDRTARFRTERQT